MHNTYSENESSTRVLVLSTKMIASVPECIIPQGKFYHDFDDSK